MMSYHNNHRQLVRKAPAVGALLFLAAAVICAGVVFGRTVLLRQQSRAFVDGTVTTLASTWDVDHLLQDATPNARSDLKPKDLTALAGGGELLGPFGAYLGATETVPVSFRAALGGPASASYVAKARYVDGLATFRIGVVKQNGRWMINAFQANIDFLGDPDNDIKEYLLPSSPP